MKFKVTNTKPGENNFDKTKIENIFKPEILDVDPEKCPADAIMNKVRDKFHRQTGNYLENVEFSEQSVQFFREDADKCYEVNENEIYFYWKDNKEKNFPPLIIEIIKKGNTYILKDLKELCEEEIFNIKGAKRKEDKITYLRKIFIKRPEEEMEK